MKDILEIVGLALGMLAIVLCTLLLWVLGIVIGLGVPVAIIAGDHRSSCVLRLEADRRAMTQLTLQRQSFGFVRQTTKREKRSPKCLSAHW